MDMLIVMDAGEERAALGQALADLGISPLEVDDTAAARAVIERHDEVAAVLLAWRVAGGDTLGFVRELRADVRWNALPILLVTGASDLGGVGGAIEAGASEYLLPPHDSDTLLEKLLLLGVDPEQRKAA